MRRMGKPLCEAAYDAFRALSDRGQNAEAEAILRSAIRKTRSREGKLSLSYTLAAHLIASGQSVEAREVYESAEMMDPGEPDLPVATALVMIYEFEDRSGAERKLKEALRRERRKLRRRGPAFHRVCELRGVIALKEGRTRVAARELLRSLDVQEWGYLTWVGPTFSLVEELVQRGQAPAACRKYLDQATQLAESWKLAPTVERLAAIRAKL